MTLPPESPLRYDPILEQAEPNEEQTTRELIKTMHRIAETVFTHEGHARRGVHAKSHALLIAEARVAADLPAVLKQGLFANSGVYPVLMRFSTIPGDMLTDRVSVPRGVALKFVGVSGDRLPDYEDDVTQDFLLANGPVFSAAKASDFLTTAKVLAATTDRAQTLKEALSSVTRKLVTIVEAFGRPSPLLRVLGGYPPINVLSDSYFSQGALRYGDYIAKLRLTPSSPALLALRRTRIDLRNHDALRAAANRFMAENSAEWELSAQLCVDAATMPIEDPSVEWSQDRSPFVTIARIRAKPQTAWSLERERTLDTTTSFTPWRGLAAHRPLGSIMRVRREIYKASAQYRAQANGVTLHEPRSAADLPSF